LLMPIPSSWTVISMLFISGTAVVSFRTENLICPPCGVYLTALVKRLSKIFSRFNLSAIMALHLTWLLSATNSIFLASAASLMGTTTSLNISSQGTGSNFSSTLPLLSLEIFKVSLIRLFSKSPEDCILLK